MASDGAASRRPPLAPPPKRRAAGDHVLQPDLLTYKRRRRATSANASGGSAATSGPGQMSMMPNAGNSRQTLARHWTSWRDTLEGILQSSAVNQGSGGIQSCILDALRHNGCQPAEHGNLIEAQGRGREDPSGAVHANGENNGALLKLEDATANNGALVKSEDETAALLEANKAMCRNALFDILVSEKFALLCDLLASTFHVNKPDDVIGLQKIDAKMRKGDYARNPALLDRDIKQIWKKFEQVGQQMAGLASSLSAISQAYQKQASGVSEIDMTENKVEETSLVGVAHKTLRESTPPCDSGHSTIPKRSGTSGPDGICKDCGRKADSEGRIICDRCEAVYHVSCLKLAIDEDVPAKWYCPTCNQLDADIKNNKNGRSHEDCDVCEWLEFKEPEEHPEDVIGTELAVKTQESSVSSMGGDSEPDLSTTALSKLCKHCGTCEDEDKKFLVCGHPFCSYKFYHVLCLRESQIASDKQKRRACWYCPSCLCRGCFKDKDDEYTVLCDGCDDAYHIYCMNPPRDTIPKGAWYCTACCARKSVDGMKKYEKSVLESVMHARGTKRLKVAEEEQQRVSA